MAAGTHHGGESRTCGPWIVTPDRFLAPDQVAVLRRSVAQTATSGDRYDVRNAALIETLLATGLRVSETCSLAVGDLFLAPGAGQVLVGRGKGGRRRLVAISDVFAAYMQQHLAWKLKRAESIDGDAPVYVSERGGRLTRSAVHRIWKAALVRAGLPTRWGVHATRHSYAVEIYRKTRDLRLTQRQLGHASPVVTSTYANLLDDDLRAGVQRVWA
jgi:site-specific recombinase XerD